MRIYALQRLLEVNKTTLFIPNLCAPSENSDQPVHLRSLIRVFVVRMKKVLYPWQSKISPVKLLLRLHECDANLYLRWAHMFEVTFSDVEVHSTLRSCGSKCHGGFLISPQKTGTSKMSGATKYFMEQLQTYSS